MGSRSPLRGSVPCAFLRRTHHWGGLPQLKPKKKKPRRCTCCHTSSCSQTSRQTDGRSVCAPQKLHQGAATRIHQGQNKDTVQTQHSESETSDVDRRQRQQKQITRQHTWQARGCPELDSMMQWCASMGGNPSAPTAEHVGGGRNQQRHLAEKTKEHRAEVQLFYGILALFETRTLDVLQEPKQTLTFPSTSLAFTNGASTTKDCACLKAGHSSLHMPHRLMGTRALP